MKKVIAAILTMMLCFAFAGCGDSASTDETTEPETTEATETTETTEETQPAPEYKDYSHVKEITGPSYEFGMDINTVGLTPEGDVILRTEGDLAEAVGWQPTITTGVKDIYVLPFGNGGFYSILMLREDGTVSAVNTAKLRDENEIEIMDNLGDYQDVVTVEGDTTEDAKVINAVMSNGDKYLLDPYLK